MNKLFFITGAEGAGNSSIIHYLNNAVSKTKVYDFDEKGVPSNPPLQWRLDTTDYWIKKSIENSKKGFSTIISGLSFPSEIKKSKYFEKAPDIYFCLLDLNEKEREKRLIRRDASKEVINDTEQLINLKKEFQDLNNSKIINTNNKEIQQVAEEIIKWVDKKI